MFLCLHDMPLFAANEGASAGVIDAKIRSEAKKSIMKQKPPQEVQLQQEEEVPPEEDTGPAFFVKKIILEGDLMFEPAVYNPILEKFENREIRFSELTKLVSILEQLYRAKGYIAVVLLPPQKMQESAEVHLKAVVSRMGDLSVENNRYFTKWRTRSYWRIKKNDLLIYDKIRRNVMNMNENPDRMVKPILKAGKEKGTTDVVLNVEDHFPLHAGYSFDNQGVKLTGKDRTGFTIRNNNMLGLDDIFLIGTNFGTDFGALYLYHILPLTNFGTRLISSFSHAQVNPKKEYEIYGINGISQTYSLALQQNVISTDRYSGSIQIGFDFKEKHTATQSVTTVWDKERVLSFRGDLQARDRWGGWALGQGFAFGMPNRGNGWPLASRGGQHQFFKYLYSLTRLILLPWDTKAIWDLQGQFSPDKLLPQEQMFLGGARSVRGYPESDYGADQAIQSRLDYILPVFGLPKNWKLPWDTTPLREQISIIAFWDAAYGRMHDPSNTDERQDFLMGAGGGFEVRFRKNISGRFEWGVPLGNQPITEKGESQFHFTFKIDY